MSVNLVFHLLTDTNQVLSQQMQHLTTPVCLNYHSWAVAFTLSMSPEETYMVSTVQ